ncbi:MAG: tRNA (guanosine(37)-N1)-methyltransferase TrmD [Clostridia bacterium]|nr:tRNA (guanosine(37)-N1)-methyltransferase TrmD [Clostridia bacterium]
MRFDILTLFPDMVNTVLSESIIGRAQKAGLLEVHCHQIRDFSENKHRNVDDTPYGGGVGMVMAAPPIYNCYQAVKEQLAPDARRRTIYLSPRGRVFNQDIARELASYDQLTLLCGHYEGVDERVLEELVDEEISIGDYVLTGGELPACILVDAVSRLLDGVLSSPDCYEGESIASGLLEYPQYTRPPVFMGREVPPILLSGHHENIEKWRLEQSLALTEARRPDLYADYIEKHPKDTKKKKK